MDFNTPYDSYASGCSREPCNLLFSYFTDEEVRATSVREITDVSPFTQTGEPLEGGLHDPRLGPMGIAQTCKTCGLEKDCPGHMGHIELSCTMFNPVLMPTLYKLLQQVCLSCKRLRHDKERTAKLVQNLNRLRRGECADRIAPLPPPTRSGRRSNWESDCHADDASRMIVQDLTIDDGSLQVQSMPDRSQVQLIDFATRLNADIAKAREEDEREVEHAEARRVADGSEEPLENERDAATQERIRRLIDEYNKEIPPTCQNCKAKPAKWRKEGFSRLCFKHNTKEEEVALPSWLRSTVLKEVWRLEGDFLSWHLQGLYHLGPEVFFLDTLLVPPNRFRPPTENPGMQPLFHKQSAHLKELISCNNTARTMLIAAGGKEVKEFVKEDAASITFKDEGEKQRKVLDAIEALQLAVNSYMDATTSGKHPMNRVDGVRQLLERKEGLFRMKMMGKRVNFAARSVISPDPNIETSEIGIPPFVANTLTYPEVATAHNAEILRELVIRGPGRYPGAVELHVPLASGGKSVVNLMRISEEKREALAKQLVTDIESGKPPMTVFRQLRDGDPLLVNRQPTLHKPGIMAHVAKVLQHEKTIRLHYVNCNTYNADFDGDEMNLHAPQDPIGRSEALVIARADNQYLVPTSGKPLRGLIQDYVIAGVMLTKRDTYLDRGRVCHLLYSGLRAALENGNLGTGLVNTDALRKYLQHFRLRLDPPCISKPRRMWSGKQVFAMVLKNLVELVKGKAASNSGSMRGGGPGVHLDSKSQTAGDIWNGLLDGNKEEATVMWRDGDLLGGVLDKKQFGAASFGIIHTLHEMFGAKIVGSLLSAIARLFTHFLQLRGFTCAFADLILTDKTEERRDELLTGSRVTAQKVARKWLEENTESTYEGAGSRELADAAVGVLDQNIPAQKFESGMIGQMKEAWGQMINDCIPIGQKVPVPWNNFSAMVQTGAKGSKVNQSQICCCLGQQELEGRLPPLMATMRSLPCFAPYDLASRTRGYIADRFLTGIRPQEFFFHCMAGREGLVDTAVKTSRSGYLQRCLVKHLESLKISYDLSVRDSDGAILQFLYGEDGQDVTKSTYLYKFAETRANFHIVKDAGKKALDKLQGKRGVELASAPVYRAARQAALNGDAATAAEKLKRLMDSNQHLDPSARHSLTAVAKQLKREAKAKSKEGAGYQGQQTQLDPSSSLLSPAHFFGSTSERHEQELQDYLAKAKKSGDIKSEEEADEFAAHMRLRFMQCLAHPGEAVGVVAAQSMGEPSTQMTLNTFHLAGHGGANVTLGIPRLREIIQTGSRTCSTPLMKVQVLQDESGDKSHLARMRYGRQVQRSFRGLTIMECMSRLVVTSRAQMYKGHIIWTYVVSINFIPIDQINRYAPHIDATTIGATIRGNVCRKLTSRLMKVVTSIKARKVSAGRTVGGGDDEDVLAGDDEAPEAGVAAEGEEAVEAGDSDEQKPAKKRARKNLGAEDKMADEEARDDEELAKDKDKDDNEDEDEDSGMYDDGDSEVEAEDDDLDIGDVEDAMPKERPQQLAVDGEETAENQMDGSGGEKGGKRKSMSGEEPSKRQKSDPSKARAAPVVGMSDTVAKAVSQGKLVWCSTLDEETNHMTVVVHHKSSDCPHRLDVGSTFRAICEETQLSDLACEGVQKVHVRDENGQVWLECEGVNFLGLQSLPEGTIDHAKIYSNNILKLLETYGVEAARASVVKEIGAVFGHYGIDVDRRHLTLVADYMTHTGGLRAFSRAGMMHNASPLLQMSYETSCQFLTAACKDGIRDKLKSPAAALIVGNAPNLGTGMVSLLADLDKPEPAWKQSVQEIKFPGEAFNADARRELGAGSAPAR